MTPTHIRVIAIGIFTRGTELLVFQGYDKVKGSFYYRPLGGGVEPNGASRCAAPGDSRGIGRGDHRIRLLDVVENLFTVDESAAGPRDCVWLPRASSTRPSTRRGAHRPTRTTATSSQSYGVGWIRSSAQHRLVPPELFDVIGGGVLGIRVVGRRCPHCWPDVVLAIIQSRLSDFSVSAPVLTPDSEDWADHPDTTSAPIGGQPRSALHSLILPFITPAQSASPPSCSSAGARPGCRV
ncbi:MAG: hypothetical protein R3A10_21410 [Caldilineaceae bacterium]